MPCVSINQDRRRLFWATQPGACGAETTCSGDCGVPGLAIGDDGRILASDWLRGLVINMLMTDARLPDTECGYRPGAQGGHWSESYSGGDTFGTLLRKVPKSGSILESVNLIVGNARATLDRLVARGVAVSVEVTGAYRGNNTMALDVDIRGAGAIGNARVGLSVARTASGWIWGDMNGL